jgi:hypothetical protein
MELTLSLGRIDHTPRGKFCDNDQIIGNHAPAGPALQTKLAAVAAVVMPRPAPRGPHRPARVAGPPPGHSATLGHAPAA